ncbi:uncharacterized protein LOC135205326 isoform X2 [Macrobrachium nipponense]|uniref:uncharacterized protein LOC135205326 isoform X2 n=1 Tax=Macrobrachium nipponense TaxID=159736 RepID=UPI0030C896A3
MTSQATAKVASLFQIVIVLGTKASSLGLGQENAQGYDPEASITGLYTGPYFDPLAPRNFTAHLGDQAILPCTVRQLGDKSVSWVRMRDADILTVDRYTFVGDERFESHYSAPLETWNLVIKYVQERDAGLYECQVSTEPKMSQFFSLRVVIPKVEILPPGDRYVKAGSEVRIECQITDVVQLPDYIFWYHEEKRVMDHLDHNLLVAVKKTGLESITSTLTILKVPPEGSGNYTCMPSNLHTASVILHVLNEKHPAAMQGERSGASSGPGTRSCGLSVLFILVLLYNAAYFDFDGYRKQKKPRNNDGRSSPLLSSSPAKTNSLQLDGRHKKILLEALDNERDSALRRTSLESRNKPAGSDFSRAVASLIPTHDLAIELRPLGPEGNPLDAAGALDLTGVISRDLVLEERRPEHYDQKLLLGVWGGGEEGKGTLDLAGKKIHWGTSYVHQRVVSGLYNGSSPRQRTPGSLVSR